MVEPAKSPTAGIVIDALGNLKSDRVRPVRVGTVEEERNLLQGEREAHAARLDVGLLERPERQGAIGAGGGGQGVELCALGRGEDPGSEGNNFFGAREGLDVDTDIDTGVWGSSAGLRGGAGDEAHRQFHTVRLVEAQAAFRNSTPRNWRRLAVLVDRETPGMRRQRVCVRERHTG
jgi:hypothetical protein